MEIRRATAGDLAAIADVVIASLAEDPSWRSLFTSEIRHDPNYKLYIREILKTYLAPNNTEWLVLVAEAPKGLMSTIVSVAIWNVSLSKNRTTTRRDSASTLCNFSEAVEVMSSNNDLSTIDKLTALRETMSCIQNQSFQHLEPCVYLEVLATHPVYRGKGYAKALCTEVIESAQDHNLPVSVLTSARGYIFFSGLGFKDIGCASLRGPDKTLEECVVKAMVRHLRPKKSRPLVVNWVLQRVTM